MQLDIPTGSFNNNIFLDYLGTMTGAGRGDATGTKEGDRVGYQVQEGHDGVGHAEQCSLSEQLKKCLKHRLSSVQNIY